MSDDDGWGFSLPPLRLPPLFPRDWEPYLPIPERVRGEGNVLLAALVLDVADAVALVTVGGGLARVAVGALLAAVLAGPLGLLYAWEAASLAWTWFGIVPSATLLVLARRLFWYTVGRKS